MASFPAVWYRGEIESAQYKKTQRNLNQNQKYVNSLLSGPGRLWKMKKLVKNLIVTVPLNRIWKVHMTTRIIIQYCEKIDFVQNHAAGRPTQRSNMPRKCSKNSAKT